MKTIELSQLHSDPNLYQQIKETLDQGGTICVPGESGYKLMADLNSPTAITSMLQAKRRVKNAPSLVFVPDESWVEKVASFVSSQARVLMKALWPGQVTLLFKASDDLHPKVRKPLTKSKGWLGIRIPDSEISSNIIKTFGKPVLVSSANLAKKGGAHSAAQVKKNFGRTVDLMVDAGDLEIGENSTLVDVSNSKTSIIRTGAVSEETIMNTLKLKAGFEKSEA